MNRADWQKIAEEKLLAAQSLLAAKKWASAYYLAGYAVECGLKSCILARVAREPELIFVNKRFSEKCWTHGIEDLLELAGLAAVRDADCAKSSELAGHWSAAAAWSEDSRYKMKTEVEAKTLIDAVSSDSTGVLPWIQTRW